MKTNTLQDKLNQIQKLYDAECERSEGYRLQVLKLQKVAELARDAVEAGVIDECYLSLLRDAIEAGGMPNPRDVVPNTLTEFTEFCGIPASEPRP